MYIYIQTQYKDILHVYNYMPSLIGLKQLWCCSLLSRHRPGTAKAPGCCENCRDFLPDPPKKSSFCSIGKEFVFNGVLNVPNGVPSRLVPGEQTSLSEATTSGNIFRLFLTNSFTIIILNLQYSPCSSHFRTFHLPPVPAILCHDLRWCFRPTQQHQALHSQPSIEPLGNWICGASWKAWSELALQFGKVVILLLMVQKSGDHPTVGR